MSGMFLLASGPELHTFVIHDLVPGGPAEQAGLAVGDIRRVGGWAGGVRADVRQRQADVEAGEGRRVRVEVGRAGVRGAHVIVLRRLL